MKLFFVVEIDTKYELLLYFTCDGDDDDDTFRHGPYRS